MTATRPECMIEVPQAEFFALMRADGRDIMPNHDADEFTRWEVKGSRALWGWSTPGWRNPGSKRAYAVFPAAKKGG